MSSHPYTSEQSCDSFHDHNAAAKKKQEDMLRRQKELKEV
jgi:hypothetical protein